MEGPSLVIACEEFKAYLKRPIKKATGTAKLPYSKLTKSSLRKAQSWGKHLLLSFDQIHVRIHFLMFGSYRINKPRENRIPKLTLNYGAEKIFFYSCAIKEIPKNFSQDYDWSIDLMSKKWNPRNAVKSLQKKPSGMVCDLLMDQNIFAGLGNIMKNEILFLMKMHPETLISDLTTTDLKSLVKESERYSWQFYEWKKENILKRNWKVMRKKTCPTCKGKVTKKITGKLERVSHFCARCQVKIKK